MRKLLAGVLMVPSIALAEFESGNSLLQQMKSSNVADQMHAMGFVKGVIDVYLNVTICPPNGGKGITGGQLNDMIKNYLENNPAVRHKTAESIIHDALKPLWPCPQRRNNGSPI
jgi:hypothetical protein